VLGAGLTRPNMTRPVTPKSRILLALPLALPMALSLGSAACGEGEAAALTPQQEYELVIKNITEPIATIAAFEPYLQRPEDKGEYVPERRADEVKSAFFAANEIRHACNRARQAWGRDKSPLAKEFSDTFIKVNKVCADPEEMADVKKCETELKSLDKFLEEHGSKASSAGASGKFPRVSQDSITKDAKYLLDRFKMALGPTDEEKKYLAKRPDPKIEAFKLISECEGAALHADGVMKKFEKEGDPELKILAAIHKLALDAQCNWLKRSDALMQTLVQCVERDANPPPGPAPTEEEGDDPCKRACAQVDTLLRRGIPAAVFARVEKDHEEFCKKDDDKKGKK
jgi:hypothetical protein